MSVNVWESDGITSLLIESVADKTAAVLIAPELESLMYIRSDDGKGNIWRAVTGAALGTYSDDGGTFCGTVIIPTGGDGSSAWIRDYNNAVNIKWFGAIGDGVNDDSIALQIAFDSLTAGGDILMPPTNDTYLLENEVTLTSSEYNRKNLWAYGAEITTNGAFAGIKLAGGSVMGGVSIYGLKINHRGNALATAGFALRGTWYARLYNCTVEAHGVNADYSAFSLAQADPTDINTGCFWSDLIGCNCRKRLGADVGDISHGIQIKGSCNATTIRGGSLSTTINAIHHVVHTGQTYLANALLIDGVSFEGYTIAYHLNGAAASNIAGPRLVNNRFETGAQVITITGVTTQPSTPLYAAGNFLVSSAGAYLTNINDIYVNTMDMSVTPRILPSIKTAVTIQSLGGTYNPLTIKPGGGNRGIVLQNSSSDNILEFLWTGTGTKSEINGKVADDLQIRGLGGLSGTTAHANNLRGTATLSGGTVNVSFAVAEVNAAYFLFLSGDTNETFNWSAKATGGFTITSSNGSSTAKVDWLLIR